MAGSYRIALTDGYFGEKVTKYGELAEAVFADELIRTIGKTTFPRTQDAENCELAQVWVLGNQDWMSRQVPAVLRRLSEGENDSAYRIVIVGIERSGIAPEAGRGGDWESKTYRAGMARKKKHKDKRMFLHMGRELLDCMYSTHRENPSYPMKIHPEMDIPVVYRSC